MSISENVKRLSESAIASGVLGASQEALLTIWMEEDPSARSPYQLYGCPPMWKTIDLGNGLELYTRPAKTSVRLQPYEQYTMVDGISCQFMLNGKWVGQGYSYTFELFEAEGASTSEVNRYMNNTPEAKTHIYLDMNQELVLKTLIERGASFTAEAAKQHWLRGEAYYLDKRLAARRGIVRAFENGNKKALSFKQHGTQH